MQAPLPLASILVGDETLLIRCAEELLHRGHPISAVVSASEAVTAWADQEGIRLVPPGAGEAERLEGLPCDLLFSIANRRVLPPDVLRLGRQEAINFHDGPLPTYAGLNTPSWALLEGEREYGVTWHRMTEEVDRGAVLAQEPVTIEDADTSLSLNLKCFEAGLRSFRRLLDDIERGTPAPRPQAGESTVYRRRKRPRGAGVIGWASPADQLGRLVRALDFGGYDNPLALPKLVTSEGRVLFVTAAHPVEAEGEPGLILDIDDERVVVAAGGGGLALTCIRDETGEILRGDALAAYGIAAGRALPVLSAAALRALTARAEAAASDEDYWREQLRRVQPTELPYARVPRRLHTPRTLELEQAVAWGEAAAPRAFAAAFMAYLARLQDQSEVTIGVRVPDDGADPSRGREVFAQVVPLRVAFRPEQPAAEAFEAVLGALADVRRRRPYPTDLLLRTPALPDAPPAYGVVLDFTGSPDLPDAPLVIAVRPDGTSAWHADESQLDANHVLAMQSHIVRMAASAAEDSAPLAALSILTEAERERLLDRSGPRTPLDASTTIHGEFEAQVDRAPDAVAIRYLDASWTYAAVEAQANRVAHRLLEAGVEPGDRVGVALPRSPWLVASLLGVLKAGAAYVPLDPTYPQSRLQFMAEDAGLAAFLTGDSSGDLPRVDAPRFVVAPGSLDGVEAARPISALAAEGLAYVLYTSGSTGRPKGVMVEHHNVVSFFASMDEPLGPRAGTWLAATSTSFDISVLELLWTLTRGATVVIQPDDPPYVPPAPGARVERPLSFSLFYFASGEGGGDAAEKYGLLLDGARFADAHGFEAVWTPERHFHAFGGLYPNPSVASAALATITERVHLRAGSCVSPLHHPARVAEEWAVVDNLSGGRVGISFAAGWQPRDFLLRPEGFPERKERMFRDIETIRALWQGEEVSFSGHDGEPVAVRTLPRPVQADLPVWITAAGNPETFRAAGEKGYHVLTHLLGQRTEDLAEKIALYREARRAAGHDPAAGRITLMLHTFVGDDDEAVRETVRAPMKAYLRSSIGLIQAAAWSFPTFQAQTTDAQGRFTVDGLSDDAIEEVLDFSFERYFETSALFGSPASCRRRIEQVRAIGVDEVACLIDFGVPAPAVRAMLPALAALHEEVNAVGAAAAAPTVGEALRSYGITHFQCTPTQARLLTADPDTAAAVGELECLLVGGEALPGALAAELRAAGPRRFLNVYGPTEATIWSSAHPVVEDSEGIVPIGRSLAGERFYILDARRRLVPEGVVGELWIAGAGVARGYLGRPDLTAERFVADPVVTGERMYRTGDLVRRRRDGVVEFVGRDDTQVKVRGYRIELGEVESALQAHEAVREAVAVVREGVEGVTQLVAFYVATAGSTPSRDELRDHLGGRLPGYMLPDAFVALEAFPLTLNHKVDRPALLALPVGQHAASEGTSAPPAPARAAQTSERAPRPDYRPAIDSTPGLVDRPVEDTLIEIWRSVLNVGDVCPTDNFFDLGGHSLLALQVQARVRAELGREIRIVDVFRHPTVRALAAFVDAGASGDGQSSPNGVPLTPTPAEPQEPVITPSTPRAAMRTPSGPRPQLVEERVTVDARVEEPPVLEAEPRAPTENGSHEGALTPEQEELLALLLDEADTSVEAEESTSRLVTLREGEGGPALFAVGVFHFRPLAAHLPWRGPFYGILGEDVDPDAAYHGQVESLAARYLEDVRRVQPWGPYHFVGYCFGGLVAYEMACQLQQVGEEVAFLALLDTVNPRAGGGDDSESNKGIGKARTHWEALCNQGAAYLWKWGKQRAHFERARVEISVKRAIHSLYRRLGRAVPPWLRGTGTYEANMAAAAVYEPQPLRGAMTLVLGVFESDDPTVVARGGWEAVIDGPIDVVIIESEHHMDILREPKVENLAAALGQSIERIGIGARTESVAGPNP